MARSPHRTRRGAGFSMIEVLAGMSFLSISFLGLTSLSLMTIKATSEARHISAATNLARTKVEELRGVAYAALASGSDAPLAEDGASGGPAAIYSRAWHVATGPTATSKRVTVTVAWTDSAPHQISLETAIAQ